MNTIIACSSGSDKNVAISLIRISGFDDLIVFNNYFDIDLNKVTSRKAYFCKVLDSQGVCLDDVVITYFKSPFSYNGENILEVSAHGNVLNVKNIINMFERAGLARPAENGEFTLRALRNKKLTLSQVEGLGQMLNSNTEYDLREGLSLLNGSLNRDYQSLYKSLKELMITFELMMDFSEDVGIDHLRKRVQVSIESFGSVFSDLLERAKFGKKRYLSLDMCLFGKPNAGKSTLFNSILSLERAIVSKVPGTTRDYISESIVFNNNEFRLVDTAGVRDSSNEIEIEGIEKSKSLLVDSFFKILVTAEIGDNPDLISGVEYDLVVVTHTEGLDLASVDEKIANLAKLAPVLIVEKCSNASGFHIPKFIVFRKDIFQSTFVEVVEEMLGDDLCSSYFSENIKNGSIGPGESGSIGPDESGSIGPDESGSGISCKKCTASPMILALSKRNVGSIILNLASGKLKKELRDKPLTIDRHIESLISCEVLYKDLLSIIAKDGLDLGLLLGICSELSDELEALVGVIPADDLLDSIFGNFCIGK